MQRKNFILFIFCFLMLVHSYIFSCTMILVGKEATADGSILLAHNNDLPDNIASMIRIIPARKHPKGEMIVLKNGLQIPKAPQTYRMLMMNCYYGFAEGDAKAINEYQVAIAGGTSLKDDRNEKARKLDPLIKQGVSGYIRYIALQRSKTARECVELIGKMYTEYGISYPSAVGVADPNEAWYIEAGGGKCWVAQRIPDNSYLVAANGYRIGEININDKENFICPPYLLDYTLKKGLWKPGKGFFNFSKVFGGKKRQEGSYYNVRRVWRAQQLLTPSFRQEPDFTLNPLTMKPDQKITIPKLIEILRDYYQGTPFDVSKGRVPRSGEKERAIGVLNTVHTDIIQLRKDLPAEIGAVMWGGVSASLTTPYVPYYFGIKEIPAAYQIAGPEFDDRSAFWQFRQITSLLESKFSQMSGEILPVWQEFENRLFAMQESVEKTALELHKKDKELAKDFLTIYSNGLSLKALEMAKELSSRL